MKMNRLLLFIVLICSCGAFCQTPPAIALRSGQIQPQPNISKTQVDSFYANSVRYLDRTFALLQFEKLPAADVKKQLAAAGIELLDYVSGNAYTVSISGRPAAELLQKAGARAIAALQPVQKMEARLAAGSLPAWSMKVQGTVDVWISFPKTFTLQEVTRGLNLLNIDIVSQQHHAYRVLALRLAPARLAELASQPFVEYVQLAPKGDQLLNFNSRSASRANLLNASVADGGKGLNGEGVAIGIGDDADLQVHIDFAGRLINRAAAPLNAGHGHHVAGTLAGSGNGQDIFKGYAPKATIISQSFNGIIMNAPAYVNDHGMVITNNSYGDNIECTYHGTYDLYSRLLDQMAFDYPHLQNVFAAGNSGPSTCAPFLPTYHTVLGGYQSAKNVITVGATNDSGAIAAFSSRGPVKDGRTKPEIVAMGQFVASAWFGNFYSYNNGTSMAAPAVAGGLGLLYQRYRQLHGGANPKNGLMKALVCNGTTDRGNTGPDFQYGFGWMNLLRSVDMLENNRYVIGSCTQGSIDNLNITVPPNTARLKLMLYWNDPAASPLAAHTLVNDLDLELVDAGSVTRLPLVPDTNNALLAGPAAAAADHINNMEQIAVENPVAGNYTIRVKGTAITQNPSQEYFLVYDLIPVGLQLTSPAGGETLTPTAQLASAQISWEAHGFSSGTATIEFSPDNGASWSTIASNVNINRSVYTWWIPNVATNQARIRITKDGSGETSTSNAFVITDLPVVSLAANQCEGYININWTAVTAATDYEVMLLKDGEMKPVATTTANSYSLGGLDKNREYWITVRPRINGVAGRRGAAISRIPNNGSCSGSISDNDLALDAIIAPVSGRRFTSGQPGAAAVVTIRVKNLDDAPVTGFDLRYSINGGAFVSESVATPIAAGATVNHTFTTTADLSAPGLYQITAIVKNSAGDPVTANDTAYRSVRHLDNQALDLASAFVDDLEAATTETYERDTLGLAGIDRYDFSRSTSYGRLRTFVNSGMAFSGSKALTLDVNRFLPSSNTNYLYGTYNLVNYSAAGNDIRLDFQYSHHGQSSHLNNKVWIRGNDAQSWIEALDLSAIQQNPGNYARVASIEVSDLLLAAGQDFGTSFQVRWGQWGQLPATDRLQANGYSVDNVRIYEAFNDLQMLGLDAPAAASCGLDNNTTIQVSVRNSSNASIVNVPVRYRINGGAWASATIASIAANTSLSFSFPVAADLSAQGSYTIEAIVDYAADSFRDNDTTIVTVVNAPVVSSFPYLENFEAGASNWYINGKNPSWEYGTPASAKIVGAASGAKAWKTRLTGNYNDYELSYLNSPCFDISGMSNPTLSFSLALDLEDCGAQLCDGAWVEYSADGESWTKLGASGNGTNWYNKTGDNVWSVQNFGRWRVATIPLPTGISRLRLRFVMGSDPAVNREGIAVDDIHVYDNTMGIYEGPTMASPVTQAVSGNSWVHIITGGKLVASVHPNNQDLGSTSTRAFIHNGAVRYTPYQYYHNRNITIQPSTVNLADSVTVRFYFLETETDTLIKATGCPGCTKPSSAYALGVSKYSDPDDSFENGTISDNNQGQWSFLQPASVAKVPFDKGYYAEFKVKDFSEFWLNNGGFTNSMPLPVTLIEFTARRGTATDVLLKWKVAAETNLSHYELQVARGEADLQAGRFSKIGEVAALGTGSGSREYDFTDLESGKSGARYYRLKSIDQDGSFSYSAVRPVLFEGVDLWQVYPNPSPDGLFDLVFQVDPSQEIKIRLLDAAGSLVKEYLRKGNGSVQKLRLDLSRHAAGVYLLQAEGGGKQQSFKLYKQ
ncbi:MAG TPA: S8 family serine peptidase [Flavisolibacter sp.]|nr:S8 family serine peptidase [Flavisolibacter sp.]